MRDASEMTGQEQQADVPARPPGGKALLRLLQLLGSQRLDDVAGQAIVAAVTEDLAPTVQQVAAQYGLLAPRPPGEPPPGGGAGPEPPYGGGPAGAAEAQAIAEASAAAAAQLGPPTAPGPYWRSIGPWTVTNGQTYGAGVGSRVNVSGRVSAVAVDPGRPAHVLAGAANGGVWESFDRGGSWSPRTDYQTTLTVGALAFDPTTSSRVYCGTGEGDWWSWLGNGVLRSVDGGTTWASLCTAPFVGQGFYSLVVDAGNGNRLYAGTTGGLYGSTDGGTTWTQRRTQTCWSVSQVRGGGEILAGCRDGLFTSTDNGTTWTAVALPGAPTTFVRLSVSLAPSNPQVAYAWGSRANADGSVTALLWRRAAGTWTSVAPPADVSAGQSWYDWYVAAAPDVDTQVYLGAIDLHRGDLAGTTWTWRNLSSKTSGNSIHPDQHSIAFEPGQPNVVYAGCDGGLYASPDRGVTWRSCNNGLEISEFEYIAHDLGTSRFVLGGTQDNGTNRWLGSSTWEHVGDADGGDCGVNRTTPATVFHTRQNGTMLRSTTSGGFGSWTFVTPTRPAGEGPGLFYVPVECSASAGDTLALGGQALYVSRDNGANWTRLAYPTAGTASAVYAPDPETVLVGLTDGRVFRTRFASGAWGTLTALTTPRTGAGISDLHTATGGGGRLWATSQARGGGRVFRSDDGGTTWTDRTAGLPDLPINAVAVDDANANRVWVGADLGVYRSLDAGQTWTTYANALPNAYIGDLIYHANARVLRAATRNRGIWEIPVDGWLTAPICGTQWTGTLAANETRRWFTWGWPATWHMVWTMVPTTPAPGAPQVSWTVQTERANAEWITYWITVRNLTARPVSFEGRRAVLSWY
jgi:hypothetical protein